jgi:hypothetical protein
MDSDNSLLYIIHKFNNLKSLTINHMDEDIDEDLEGYLTDSKNQF